MFDWLPRAVLIWLLRALMNGTSLVSRRLAGRLAYKVLSRPQRFPFDPEAHAFLQEAEQEYMNADGERIHLYTWPGGSRSVLLAHGWESHTGRWEPFVQALRKHDFTIYALDAPAHGRSSGDHFTVLHYARALAEVIAYRQPQMIVGHSAGGMATIFYLTQYENPHPIERIALLATPAELADFIRAFQNTLGVWPAVIQGLEDVFLERLSQPFSYYSISEFCRKLDVPGLIIHDRYDDIAPFAGAEATARNYRNSRFIITEKLGHSLMSPGVVKEVVAFLTEWDTVRS